MLLAQCPQVMSLTSKVTSSHDALDDDKAVQEEVGNVAHQVRSCLVRKLLGIPS